MAENRFYDFPSRVILLTLSFCLACILSTKASALEQWGFYEQSFTTSKKCKNPWLDVQLWATFTHADTGRTLRVPGFYDGDGKGGQNGNVWKIRFMPPLTGRWHYVTECDDPELNGRTGSLTAEPPTGDNHGIVVQYPNKPNRFSYIDGTPFYLLGDGENSYKFLVSLEANDGKAEQQAAYDLGHNINTRSTISNSQYVPAPYASGFVGGVHGPYREMNMRFWHNLDKGYQFYLAHGYQLAHSFLGWNDADQYKHEDIFDEYMRYGVARLWAYRCLMTYNLGGEVNEHRDKAWAEKWMKFIHAQDPIGRKVAVHHGTYWAWYGDEGRDWWLGIWAQLWMSADDLNATVLKMRGKTDKPVWVVEYIYLPNYRDSGPQAARQKTWAIYLAGGYGYGDSVADIFPWSSDWIPQVSRMMDILRQTRYPDLTPHNELISSGGHGVYCMARPGEQYVIYGFNGKPVELNLKGQPGDYDVHWYDPLTEKGSVKGKSIKGGGDLSLNSPFDHGEYCVIVTRLR